MRWHLILVALFAAVASGACPATINTISLDSDTSLVTVEGPLVATDADQFKTKTASISKALVMLVSDGGNLYTGLQIGETIRLKNFASFVPDGSRCASACALAWLGGTKRLMGKNSQIGFHSASDFKTGNISSAGDALIGAYLNKIGIPERVIVYVTSPSPSEIQWLNLEDAKNLGLDVEIFTAPSIYGSLEQPNLNTASLFPIINEIALNSDELETANRLARDFYVRYKASRMTGFSAFIQNCYSYANESRKYVSLVYCLAFDNLISDFDLEIASKQNRKPQEYFKIDNVKARSKSAIASIGNSAPQTVSLAIAIKRLAYFKVIKLAMRSPERQSAVPVADAPVVFTPAKNSNSQDAVNEACSQRADALGLHARERKRFRQQCKADTR